MTSRLRREGRVALDLPAIVERLQEVHDYLNQLMVEDPDNGVLDFPYAVIGEVIQEIEDECDETNED